MNLATLPGDAATPHGGPRPRIAVLGGGGRVGALLRGSGALPGALWFSRRGGSAAGQGLRAWDLLAEAGPPAALHGAEVMICLAGAVPGAVPGTDLAANTSLALAAVAAARAAGIAHLLIASSAAVYGREGAPWREGAPLSPANPYGRAKAGMEAALPACARAGGPQICRLRIGNVVGADALSTAIAGGRVLMLDRCPGGGSPRRSVIGPVTLARVLLALAARAQSGAGLPPVLNVAQPEPVAMSALCLAAGRGFAWRAPGPATLPLAALDLSLLQALLPVPLPSADAATLIGEWRAAGGLR